MSKIQTTIQLLVRSTTLLKWDISGFFIPPSQLLNCRLPCFDCLCISKLCDRPCEQRWPVWDEGCGCSQSSSQSPKRKSPWNDSDFCVMILICQQFRLLRKQMEKLLEHYSGLLVIISFSLITKHLWLGENDDYRKILNSLSDCREIFAIYCRLVTLQVLSVTTLKSIFGPIKSSVPDFKLYKLHNKYMCFVHTEILGLQYNVFLILF